MLIDSHAHLDAPYFADKLPDVLQRAWQAGVRQVITIGVTPGSTKKSLEIATRFSAIQVAAGYHPHWADGATTDRLMEVERLAQDARIVALGEIGLDYHHFRSPKTDQIRLFRTMLDIAAMSKLPVIIHDRNAHADVFRILCDLRGRLAGGVIHCFSGDWNLARKYLELGFFLSIPGPVTVPAAAHLREVAKKVPLDHLLLETDAPHLTPAQRRGSQNEPAFVRFTAQEVARLRGIAEETLAQATTRNVSCAFRMPHDASAKNSLPHPPIPPQRS
jgi:TatD DNase family protein